MGPSLAPKLHSICWKNRALWLMHLANGITTCFMNFLAAWVKVNVPNMVCLMLANIFTWTKVIFEIYHILSHYITFHCIILQFKGCGSDCGPGRIDWASLQGAMQVLGISDKDQNGIIRILASVLHLGNVSLDICARFCPFTYVKTLRLKYLSNLHS